MTRKEVEPKTTYTISLAISTVTTAGKVANERGYYDIEVPSSGPHSVVEWTTTAYTLDDLVDVTHRMLKLYGGTIGFIVDAPRGRGVAGLVDPFVDPDPKNRR